VQADKAGAGSVRGQGREGAGKRDDGRAEERNCPEGGGYEVEQRKGQKMTLKEFKSRFKVGGRFECVENTKRPELNGDIRTILKVQTESVCYSSERMSGRCWTAFPKARDIVSVEGDTVKFRMGDEEKIGDIATQHFLSFRIARGEK
jgi:hypothetical protein